MTGLVPPSEAGLAPGESLETKFHVGQVKVCRVLSSDPANKRIALSLLVCCPRRRVTLLTRQLGLQKSGQPNAIQKEEKEFDSLKVGTVRNTVLFVRHHNKIISLLQDKSKASPRRELYLR